MITDKKYFFEKKVTENLKKLPKIQKNDQKFEKMTENSKNDRK